MINKPSNAKCVLTSASIVAKLVWHILYDSNVMCIGMEDQKRQNEIYKYIFKLSGELVLDILDLAEYVEVGPADPEHAACKAEEFIEVVGVIYALHDQDIDHRVIANIEEVLHCFTDNHGSTDQDIDHRVIANLEEVLHCFAGTRVQQTRGPGRLAFDIPTAVLEHQVLSGIPACQIAAMFGVSTKTIRRKRDLYSAVNDEELDHIITEPHRRHPNTSYKLMHGHLKARGVFSRLQESLCRVDAEGVYMRRLRLCVLRRRQYSVPGPNSLWHIDGNHKPSGGDFLASTVLQRFNTAEQYGLPSRVRSDKGGENADVAEFMIRNRGANRNLHITGRSVHNQIERMWRDVYEHALDIFYQIFTSLEDQGTLNPDNEVHLTNQSPQQLWRRYREQGPMEDPTEVYEDYGIDWNGPHSLHGGTVSVPKIQLARERLDEEVAILPAPGVSVTDTLRSYIETVQVLSRIIAD
uniref:Integrase core domain-containing protein n=1 Tax=Myripristis murdjan TaxID=586833 RepID=A0A667ZKG8_9TELE